MLFKTQAIIIKKANLNDMDRLLTAYTKDFGKILLKAKSVRKNQAKLKGHLELFLHSHLMIAPGKGFDIITGAETVNSFPYLHQSLPCLATSYYLSDLTDKLISGSEKDKNIWQLFLTSLTELDQQQEPKLIVNNFENKILEFLGYGQQKNFVNFVESLLNERLQSRLLLEGF